MEDMARIGVIEQKVGDDEKFINILSELLHVLYQILENPHDNELRAIKNDILVNVIPHNEAFVDYLEHVGFKLEGNGYVYPMQLSLNNLRLAQASIERKIYFISGKLDNFVTPTSNTKKEGRPCLQPVNILNTTNKFLLEIESLFNKVLKFEDEGLLEQARQHIPLVTLQLKAVDRLREHQRKLKNGEIKGHDMNFDIALLIELLGWFKYKFFTWMDKPVCEECGGQTTFIGSGVFSDEDETCRVEHYRCVKCRSETAFRRYNNPRRLLRTRTGRCGEWAACFMTLCRALGYDTRYVVDFADHVWCEVFDYDSKRWLHVDPCENALDTPLMYCHGWKKKLSYVMAFSRDDLQDVTWRYTMKHKEVLARRSRCDEWELVQTQLNLRAARQQPVSPARRRYLVHRSLAELSQLMIERTPTDYESHGRMSGASEWRRARGEGGGHVFTLKAAGVYVIRYFSSEDKYTVTHDDIEIETLTGWEAGVWEHKSMFRKVEQDWKMVYIAREEDKDQGSISWSLAAGEQLEIRSVGVRAVTSLYETGYVHWDMQFDETDPLSVKIGDSGVEFQQRCQQVRVRAGVGGGGMWQHAQLFRSPAHSAQSAELVIHAVVDKLVQ